MAQYFYLQIGKVIPTPHHLRMMMSLFPHHSTPSYILTYGYMGREGVSVQVQFMFSYTYWNNYSVANLEVGRSAVQLLAE